YKIRRFGSGSIGYSIGLPGFGSRLRGISASSSIYVRTEFRILIVRQTLTRIIMKRNKLMILLSAGMLFISSCGKEFLQKLPQGQLSEPQVGNKDGVEAALIGAYSILDVNVSRTWEDYAAAPRQWIFGELASDKAHKGSELTDHTPMNMIETYNVNSTTDNLST